MKIENIMVTLLSLLLVFYFYSTSLTKEKIMHLDSNGTLVCQDASGYSFNVSAKDIDRNRTISLGATMIKFYFYLKADEQKLARKVEWSNCEITIHRIETPPTE